jgi:hypothetical protein
VARRGWPAFTKPFACSNCTLAGIGESVDEYLCCDLGHWEHRLSSSWRGHPSGPDLPKPKAGVTVSSHRVWVSLVWSHRKGPLCRSESKGGRFVRVVEPRNGEVGGLAVIAD